LRSLNHILHDGTLLLTTGSIRLVNRLVEKAGLKSYLFGADSKLLVTFGLRSELERLVELLRTAGILDDYNLVENYYPPAFICYEDESGLGDSLVSFWLKNNHFHFMAVDDYIAQHDVIFDEEVCGGDPSKPESVCCVFRGEKQAIAELIQFCLALKCLDIYRVDHKKWQPEDRQARIKRYLYQILFRDDIKESRKNRLKERAYWREKCLKVPQKENGSPCY